MKHGYVMEMDEEIFTSSHQRRRKEVVFRRSVRTMGLVSEPLSDELIPVSVVQAVTDRHADFVSEVF